MIITEDKLPPVPDVNLYSQECFCGENRWKVWVVFDDDKEIASFSKEMFCMGCGYEAVTPPYDVMEDE